jgi:hypothetical protein
MVIAGDFQLIYAPSVAEPAACDLFRRYSEHPEAPVPPLFAHVFKLYATGLAGKPGTQTLNLILISTGKTVVIHRECDILLFETRLHPVVPVKHDLKSERWITAHFYHNMAPVFIKYMKTVMLDERPWLFVLKIYYLPFFVLSDPPYRCGSLARQNKKQSPLSGLFGILYMSGGDFVFPRGAVALYELNLVSGTVPPHGACHIPGKPADTVIIEIAITSKKFPPPGTESTGTAGEVETTVKNDSVDTVIAPVN